MDTFSRNDVYEITQRLDEGQDFSDWLGGAQRREWMRDWEKVSALPAYGMGDDEIATLWEAEMASRRSGVITELELTATTLVAQSIKNGDIINPHVLAWATGFISSVSWTVFSPDETHTNGNSYDTSPWKLNFASYLSEHVYGRDATQNEIHSAKILNDAILSLGHELAQYRRKNRKGGENTSVISRMGEITITTSLPAVIGEFVCALRHSHAALMGY